MIRIKDDGYEDVEIELPDGTVNVVRLNTYLVGFQLVEAGNEHKASDGTASQWAERVRAILDANGLKDLSTKACIDAADAILGEMKKTEGKSEATPPAE